jgi:molybdenum cofactor synthesis domain-containing protein
MTTPTPRPPSLHAPCAAVLIVGDEILTGKVTDANTPFAASALYARGIPMRKAVVCGDHPATIASELRELARAHTWVFTSGGIGVTHDDVTVQAVASAFDEPIVRSPEAHAVVTSHFGPDVTERQLRMADVPRGAELVYSPDSAWPTIRMRNVFVLPGIPSLFRRRLQFLLTTLEAGPMYHTREALLQCEEWEIADTLDELVKAFPAVHIGSYPSTEPSAYRVKITFDGTDEGELQRAASTLQSAIESPKRAI